MSDSLLWSIVLAVAVLVLAWGVWRSVRPRARRPQQYGPPPRTVPDESTVRRIDQLIEAGKTIEAVKVLRQATGLGLVEAKNRVDRWDSEGAAPEPALDRTALDAEVRLVVAERGEIAAMKRLRERTGWGLADAKAYIDQLGPR